MSEENQSPGGGVTAHLTIPDGRGGEAIDFYKNAFGAQEEMRNLADDGKRLMHAHLKVNGGSLMLNDDFPEYARAASRFHRPRERRSTSTCPMPTRCGTRPWPPAPR